MMNHTDTIKALGGAKCVADSLRARGVSVKDVTVRSWTLSGRAIPARYWRHIEDIGRHRGKPVSYEALAQQVSA